MNMTPVRMAGQQAVYRHQHPEKAVYPRFGHHSPEHSALEVWHVLAAGGTSLTLMALYAREQVKSMFNAVFRRGKKADVKKETQE